MTPTGSLTGGLGAVGDVSTGPPPSQRAAGSRGGVPVRRGPPTTDAVDAQLAKLEERLLAEVADDAVAMLAVRSHLAAARARFAGATVRQFLPILVERVVRRRMRESLAPR